MNLLTKKIFDNIHSCETTQELDVVLANVKEEAAAERITYTDALSLMGAITYRTIFILPVLDQLVSANQDNPTIINQSILHGLCKK